MLATSAYAGQLPQVNTTFCADSTSSLGRRHKLYRGKARLAHERAIGSRPQGRLLREDGAAAGVSRERQS